MIRHLCEAEAEEAPRRPAAWGGRARHGPLPAGGRPRPTPAGPRAALAERRSPFSDLERKVISLGLSRGERPEILTGRQPGTLQRFLAFAFSIAVPRPLASARLEALRAMAAAVRKERIDHDPQLVQGFVAAGWQLSCIAEIRRLAKLDQPCSG